MSSDRNDAYSRLGASTSKAEVHAAVAGMDPGLFPTAFCRIGPDVLGGDPEWCATLHADGAGTKALVAYLIYRETADPGVFRGIAQDALVMNTDDLACIGATDRFVFVNTIGRNSRYIPGEVVRELAAGFLDFAATLEPYGIQLISTGGETADLGDAVRTIVVDAAVGTRLPRKKVVDAARIVPGDVIVGLSSTGQAVYEHRPDSSMGSNGLTLARHVLLHREYLERYPETVAPETDRDLLYRGKHRLSDPLADAGMSVGEALTAPTRTYIPIIHRLLEELGANIHGMIHNTGGGLGKCLRFGNGIRYIKDSLFPLPALFRAIAAEGISPRELATTFNCGHRLEVMLSESFADRVISIARGFNVDAKIIGRCEAAERSSVLVRAEWGEVDLS